MKEKKADDMYYTLFKYFVEDCKNKPRELEKLRALRNLNFAMLQVLDHYIFKAARRRMRYKQSRSI